MRLDLYKKVRFREKIGAFLFHTLQSHLSELLVFIYCPVVLLKMGWFENEPYLLILMLG